MTPNTNKVFFAILLQTLHGRRLYRRHRNQKNPYKNQQNTSIPQNSGNLNRNRSERQNDGTIISRKENDLIESNSSYGGEYQRRGRIHDENTSKSQQDPSATQVPEMQHRPDDELNLKADENAPIGLSDIGGRKHFWGHSRSIHSYRSPRNRPHWYHSYPTSRPTLLPMLQKKLSSRPSILGLHSYPLPSIYIPQLPPILPLSPKPPPKWPQRNNVEFNQAECLKSCPVTFEYKPVCGSDNITYSNPRHLECAQSCGADVKISRNLTCLRETDGIGRDKLGTTAETNFNEAYSTEQELVDIVTCIQHCPVSEHITSFKCAKSCGFDTYIIALRDTLCPISNGTKNYNNSSSINYLPPPTEEHLRNETHSKDESTETTFSNDNTNKATNTLSKYSNETVENSTEESTARETYTKNTESNGYGEIGEESVKPYLNAETDNNETKLSMHEVVACTQHCPLTSEYNPVCGTDGITYTNPGRLLCYQFCGFNVKVKNFAPCSLDSVVFKWPLSLTEADPPWMQNIEKLIDLLPSKQPVVLDIFDPMLENKEKNRRKVIRNIKNPKKEEKIRNCISACPDIQIHEFNNFQCGSEIINTNIDRMKCELDCGRDELAKCIPLKNEDNSTKFSPNRTIQNENSKPLNQTRLNCESICFVTTNEKKPVCGTNNVTYKNIECMECAKQCGVDVEVKSYAPCSSPRFDNLSYLHNHTILTHGIVDPAPFIDPLDNMEFANNNGTRFVDSINNIDSLDNNIDYVSSDSNYNVESSASTYNIEGTISAVVLDDIFGSVKPKIQSNETKEANNHGVKLSNSMGPDTAHKYQRDATTGYGVDFTIPANVMDKIFDSQKSVADNTPASIKTRAS